MLDMTFFLFALNVLLDEILLMKFRRFFLALLLFCALVLVRFLVAVFVFVSGCALAFVGGMDLFTIIFACLLTFVMMHWRICYFMMTLCVCSESWPPINPIFMGIRSQHRFLHIIKLINTIIRQIFMNLRFLK